MGRSSERSLSFEEVKDGRYGVYQRAQQDVQSVPEL